VDPGFAKAGWTTVSTVYESITETKESKTPEAESFLWTSFFIHHSNGSCLFS